MQKGKEILIRIERVGFKGVGVGVLEKALNEELLDDDIGKKVLVQNTLPGELVLANVSRNKKNYIEARKVKTLEVSPLAVEPRCPHFEICGGCKWQNLPYDEQLKLKQEHVREALEHIGGFENLEEVVRPIIGCSSPWNYRNKVELSFGWDENMEQTFGFHSEGRRHDIFDISECHLMSPRMFEIATSVKGFVEKNNLKPFKFRENAGLLRSLIIREGKNTGEVLVDLLCSGEDFPANLKEEFVEILKNLNVDSVYLTHIKTARGQRTQREDILLHGKEKIEEKMTISRDENDGAHNEQYTFEISPSSFFQPNTLQAEILYKEAIENLKLEPDDTVLDLFCGTGTIGIILAKFASQVIGIELNPDAVEDAKKNAELNNEGNIEFLVGDVGKVLEELENEGQLDKLVGKKIVIDPPRSGLTPLMIEYILKLSPTTISYVSCNPSTQARDLKDLYENGYKITSVQPVDMFPHTYHIENVVGLSKSLGEESKAS